MKHLQHHKPGLTFIEVMLALTILGLMTSSVLVLQSSAVNSIAYYSNRLARIFLLEGLLVKASLSTHQKSQMESPIELKDPPTTLEYKRGKPAQNSVLARFTSIDVRHVKARWQQEGRTYDAVLHSYVYKPEKKKE